MWYGLISLAPTFVKTSLRKSGDSTADLNSSKCIYKEFCGLERKKCGKWTTDNFIKGLVIVKCVSGLGDMK